MPTKAVYEAKLTELAGYIRAMTMNAYDAVLCGSPNPVQAELLRRLDNYAVGDLVVEKSTAYMKDRDLDAVGRLLEITREPIFHENDWDEEEEGPMPMQKVFHVETFDGRRFRWTNASFLAVPTHSLMGERLRVTPHSRQAP